MFTPFVQRNAFTPFSTLRPGALTIAAFPGFAPFSWKEGAEARGRDISFLQRFAASLGLEVKVEFFDFADLWELPAQGRADIAASGISLQPERRKSHLDWSAPYAEVRRTILIRAEDGEKLRTAGDFSHARLSVVAGSAAEEHGRRIASASLTYCETLEAGIEDLHAGLVDGVGTGSVSARHHLTRHHDLAMVDVHCTLPPEYISFAVRARNPLLSRLNAFIARHASAY